MAIKNNFENSQAGLIVLGNHIPIVKRQSAGKPKGGFSWLEQLAQGYFSGDHECDKYVQIQLMQGLI